MTIKDDFLREHYAGGVSKETLCKLASKFKSEKSQGRPKKTGRNIDGFFWYRIAVDLEGWKSNTAFSGLSVRLKIDERNARKAVKKGACVYKDALINLVKLDDGSEGYLVRVLVKELSKTPYIMIPLIEGVAQKTGRRPVRLAEWKYTQDFFFDKSEF